MLNHSAWGLYFLNFRGAPHGAEHVLPRNRNLDLTIWANSHFTIRFWILNLWTSLYFVANFFTEPWGTQDPTLPHALDLFTTGAKDPYILGTVPPYTWILACEQDWREWTNDWLNDWQPDINDTMSECMNKWLNTWMNEWMTYSGWGCCVRLQGSRWAERSSPAGPWAPGPWGRPAPLWTNREREETEHLRKAQGKTTVTLISYEGNGHAPVRG